MYHIYYDRKNFGDVLKIVFEPKKDAQNFVEKDNLEIGYFNDKIVSIDINDFSKISRLFYEGEIIDPCNEFLALINHILINAGLEPLEAK